MIRIKSVKRKNPTDHELLNKIRIEKEINNQHIIYYIIYNNEIIGDAYYSKSKNDYKIVISGYHPKEHDKYVDAVKRLNELGNK